MGLAGKEKLASEENAPPRTHGGIATPIESIAPPRT
ncbi:hypothetical protein A2U01_0065266 [Trifolium medium]|uniref:Uncharacterized protein n=1 Tax=Trifolium medium TaxID=97028 RepID=A0A392S6K0_9FABA|nr:hypothetical protein [Trifolium medium]